MSLITNLNQMLEGLTEEQLQAVNAHTEATLNKYKSDQEKGVQLLAQKNRLNEQVIDAVAEVAENAENLIKIYEENPEVAEKVLNKYYGGVSIDDYKASIGHKEDPKRLDEKLIEQKATSIVNANKIKDTKKAFIEKVGLEGEELEAFEQEFTERLELKSFSVDKLDEYLTKSYKLATGYSEDQIKERQKARSIATAGGMAGNDKVNESNKSRINKEVSDFLKGQL